jgi:single-stranded DNA-binding protein
MAEITGIKNVYGSFSFIGEATWSEKNYVTTSTSEKKWVSTNLNLGIKVSEANTLYTELKGGHYEDESNAIYTLNTNNEKLEVAYKDRLDKNILSTVASMKKIKIELEKDEANNLITKEFLAADDAINYIKTQLMKKTRIYVYGQLEVNRYKDKNGVIQVNLKKIISNLRLAKDDEKNSANGTISFYFDKDSFSKANFKTDLKYDITGYMTKYEKNLKKSIPIPIDFKIDLKNVNFEDPKHKARAEYLENVFTDIKKKSIISL